MHSGLALRLILPLLLAFPIIGSATAPSHAITADQLFEKIIPRVQPKKTKKPTATRPKPKTAPAKIAEPIAPPAAMDSAATPKPRPRPEQAADVPAPPEKPDAAPLAVAAAPLADAEPAADPDKGRRALVATVIQVGTLAPSLTAEQLAFAPPVEGSALLPEPAAPLDPAETPIGFVLPPKGTLPAPPGLDHLVDETEIEGGGAPVPRAKPEITLAAIVPPRAPLLPETLSACRAGLAALNVSAEPKPAVQQGQCGAPDPFGVSALQDGRVKLQPTATVNCETASMLSTWMSEDVQSAALSFYGEKVTGLRVLDSYSCRGRNQIAGAQLSEHAFMNAIDIGAFEIDGRWVTVEKNAEHTDKDTDFIQTVRKEACARFMTVLGPGSDGYHENHLHLDMRHRGKHGDSRYCH